MHPLQIAHGGRGGIPGAVGAEQHAGYAEGADDALRRLCGNGTGRKTRIHIHVRIGEVFDGLVRHRLPAQMGDDDLCLRECLGNAAHALRGRLVRGLEPVIDAAVEEHDHAVFGAALIDGEGEGVVYPDPLVIAVEFDPADARRVQARQFFEGVLGGRVHRAEGNDVRAGKKGNGEVVDVPLGARGDGDVQRHEFIYPLLFHQPLGIGDGAVRKGSEVRARRQRGDGARRQFI